MTNIVNASWLSTRANTVRVVQTPASTVRVVQTPAPDCRAEDRAFAMAFEQLTPHRQRLLRLRCEGLTVPEVADRVFISHQAVKNTLTLIFRAFGVSGRGAIVGIAYLLGRYDAQRQRQEVVR